MIPTTPAVWIGTLGDARPVEISVAIPAITDEGYFLVTVDGEAEQASKSAKFTRYDEYFPSAGSPTVPATVNLTNCTVSGNSGGGFGGGGVGTYNYGTTTLSNCTVSGNKSSTNGGGIWNAYGATTSLTMPRLTEQSHTILEAARSLLTAATPLIRQRGITLVGISLTNLEPTDAVQLTLTEDWRPHALDALTFLDEADAACTLLKRGVVIAIQGVGGAICRCQSGSPAMSSRLGGWG